MYPIKEKRLIRSGLLCQHTYCPGNGTKYELMSLHLDDGADFGVLGSVKANGRLIICGLTKQAYMFQPTGHLSEYYVAEKLGLKREEDIKYVTEMIREITGRL